MPAAWAAADAARKTRRRDKDGAQPFLFATAVAARGYRLPTMQVKVVALAAGAAVLLVALQAFSQTGDETAAKSLADLRVRAEQGSAEAQVELGHMYRTGRDVPEDDAEAVRWYRLAAEQGHVEAQFALGLMHVGGVGVTKDDAEALRWVRRAAEQGFARATYGLGVLYATGAAGRVGGEVAAGPPGPQVGDDDVEFALKSAIGENVQQDDAEAVRWFRLGIEQGDAGSQFALGLMYAAGEGVPQDDAEAVRWYRLAAEQGHAQAQFNLGIMYDTGRGVPQDNVSAHMWLNLAAAQSTGEDRARYVTVRDRVAEGMTREDLSEAQRRAREWSPE